MCALPSGCDSAVNEREPPQVRVNSAVRVRQIHSTRNSFHGLRVQAPWKAARCTHPRFSDWPRRSSEAHCGLQHHRCMSRRSLHPIPSRILLLSATSSQHPWCTSFYPTGPLPAPSNLPALSSALPRIPTPKSRLRRRVMSRTAELSTACWRCGASPTESSSCKSTAQAELHWRPRM